ncbi:MAG TPA: TonB-dependent receptor [Thermoanaerobaculia bacterium]|nr:TonB-dependent receptor [Thermoanaerobaculia bacterium]
MPRVLPLILVLVLAATLFAQNPPAASAGSAAAAPAVDESEKATAVAAPPPPIVFDRLTVTGGPDRVQKIPGSATYIGQAALDQQKYTDIHRILRQVPGVNIQEEDGYGLRPNIGMRGTGVERSGKITILEDGVLIAPAPYAAPAAYYFPTVGRMVGIEVRKGSTAVRQGPYTTGGALNLLSSSIPSDFGGRIDFAYGDNAMTRGRIVVGDTVGRLGWLFETFQQSTDGFKRLDGGGPTGFDLSDYLGKLRWNSAAGSRFSQALELKVGRTSQKGDETYLGLTESDFQTTPFRRYAASQMDVIDAEHEQIQLTHFFAPGAAWDVTTTVYRNDFFRNWHKLDSVAGVGIGAALESPGQHAGVMAIIRGEADDAGTLRVRNNRRDYYGQGVQSVFATRFSAASASHQLEVGVRYHQDGEDRFQEDERYGMNGGRMFLARTDVAGSNANRLTEAKAAAFFVQDEIRFGRWRVTPGLRFESIDFEVRNFGNADPDRNGAALRTTRNSVEALVPGVGVAYAVSPSLDVFAGVHRGFAPPGAGVNEDTAAEESINYEAGFRLNGGPVNAEVVGFFNDYRNLLGRDTLSTGGTGSGDLFNGGAVQVRGLELAMDREMRRGALSMPFRLAYTWTEAEFMSSFTTSFEDWAPEVHAGDEVPYIPGHQLTLTAGMSRGRWNGDAQFSWNGAMRTAPGRGAIPAGSGTDSYFTTDLTVGYGLLSGLELFVQGRNLTDERYIAARRPAGLRPGLPRTLLTGVTWKF